MFLTKFTKAFNKSLVFKGDATRQHLLRNLMANQETAEILQTLTTKQLTAVINVANESYHDGKNSCGAESHDDCLWIGGSVQKLIPWEALETISIVHQFKVTRDAKRQHSDGTISDTIIVDNLTRYSMDYIERH